MLSFRVVIACVIWILSYTAVFSKEPIVTDYTRIFSPIFEKDGRLMMAIRFFYLNNIPSFLVVDLNELTTKVAPVDSFLTRAHAKKPDNPGYYTYQQIADSRYLKLLNHYTEAPYPIENQGITHIAGLKQNVLSIDLCPSSHKFERAFFQKLVELSKKTGTPTPIAVSVSGLWMIKHPEEFNWLISMQQDHALDITWVNHSFMHAYYHDLPDTSNFLLTPGTNVDNEILATEKYLIERGLTPSLFFRFPGLVSDKNLILTLKRYGLIPLGSGSWLAKDEPIRPGNVILVHGNGNERPGIIQIMPLLDSLSLISLTDALIK